MTTPFRILAALGLGLWFAPVVPAIPRGTLDSNWMLGLSAACEAGLKFGSDIVFTYGPYGCLINRQYWPSQYWAAVFFCAAVGMLSAWLASTAVRTRLEAVASLCALFWLGATATMMPDTAMLALPMAYALRARRGVPGHFEKFVSIVLMAFVALSKFTLFPLCLLAVVTAPLAHSVSRPRAWLRQLTADAGLFALALLGAWLMAGQSIGELPLFVAGSVEISRGYAQAMAWPPPDSLRFLATLAIPAFALAALIVNAWPLERHATTRQIAWLVFTAGWCSVATKHAVVRADEWHLVIGASMIGALEFAQVQSLRAGRILLLIAALSLGVNLKLADMAGFVGAPFDAMESKVEWLASPGREIESLRAQWTEFQHKVKASAPELSHLATSYDLIGHDQHLMLQAGVDAWKPRPVFQSYSAYTPVLAKANAHAIEGGLAPELLVVSGTTIDGRLVTMDDAYLWPLMWRRYEPITAVGGRAVLRRRAEERVIPKAEPAVVADCIDWCKPFIPEETSQVGIYLRLEWEESMGDRLRAVIWRPKVYFLQIKGLERPMTFRIVPEIARSGFMLWPLIRSVGDLEKWLRGEDARVPSALEIRVIDERGRPNHVRATSSRTPFKQL